MAGSRKPRGVESVFDAVIEPVARMLRGRVRTGDAITVGLSGGIDSIVLLDALRRIGPSLGLRVSALHVNHGLSSNASAWETFCRAHCARRRLPFDAVRVKVAGDGVNVEAQARLARYRAFARRTDGFVALAHNEDDQAETVLLRLLRGAGVHGLAGMQEARSLDGCDIEDGVGRVIRPLLSVSREAIRSYALARRLRWIEDESNDDRRYARNFLRHEIMPRLDERFPNARAKLARAAAHLRDADRVLEAVARDDLRRVIVAGCVEIAKLVDLGDARAANALRALLIRAGEPPIAMATTHELLRQLTTAADDAHPEIRLSQVVVRRYRGRIAVHPLGDSGPAPGWQSVAWSGAAEQRLPDGSSVGCRGTIGSGVSRARLAAGAVRLQRRRGGERVRLRPEGPTRTLKNLLQERAVPPWVREGMPLLYCNEQLVWIPGVGVAAAFQARPDEAAWEFSWQAVQRPRSE